MRSYTMKLQSRKKPDILNKLVKHILSSLDELRCCKPADDFVIGQRYAYADCLELLQSFSLCIDFDIEKCYPLE